MYRNYSYVVKDKRSELYLYLEDICRKAKNLWNVGNFYIRQNMTGLKKKKTERQPNEREVIALTQKGINIMNARKKEKRSPEAGMLTAERWFLNYYLLNDVLKNTENFDYRELPAQVSQGVLKKCCGSWESYFKANRDYKKHPEKYKGKPKIPKYKKSGMTEVVFTNQTCRIKENENGKRYLSFPKSKAKLWLGKRAPSSFQQVEVIPKHWCFEIHIIFDDKEEVPDIPKESKRIAAVDIGVDNLAAITNNVGLRPIIIKGRVLKSYNQWANKEISRLKSILSKNQSNESKDSVYTTMKMHNIWYKRERRINDYFHKAAKRVVDYLLENQIDTLVAGHNPGWKQKAGMGKVNNQNFVCIPFDKFIFMLEYLCARCGIRFIKREESYTSKASFLDSDAMPIYMKETSVISFSGKRISRGLYKSADGTILNADVNGSFNILRKVFPDALDLRHVGNLYPFVLKVS